MLLSHPTRRLRWRAAAALMLVAATGVVTTLPASAASSPVSAPVTGSLDTNDRVSVFDGVIWSGTFDADTGALDGKFVSPVTTVHTETPVPADLTVQVRQAANGAGMVDLVANTVTLEADLVLALLTVNTGGTDIPLEPCNFTMPISLTGTFDPDSLVVDLSADGFAIAAVAEVPHCQGLEALIDTELVGSNNAFVASFDLGVTDAPPPYSGCQATVSDTSPAPGQAVTVSGTGADAGTVSATINGTQVGSGTASSDGAFSFTATIPQVSGAVTMAVDCGASVDNLALTVGGGPAPARPGLPRTGASSTLPMTAGALAMFALGGVALTAAKLRRAKLENA